MDPQASIFCRIAELQHKLENSLTELEQLRESRQHQMQLVDSIVRQRDMYRILLSQTTGMAIPLQGRFIITSGKHFRNILVNRFCNKQ